MKFEIVSGGVHREWVNTVYLPPQNFQFSNKMESQLRGVLLSFDAGGISVCPSSHQIESNTRPSLEMGPHFQVLVVVESLTFDVVTS